MATRTWSDLHARGALGPTVEFNDGAMVTAQGKPAVCAWFHARGQLEVFQHGSNERQSYLARILVAPTIIGLGECLAGETSYLKTTRVLESAALVALPRADALALLSRHPALCSHTYVEFSRAFCGVARLERTRVVDLTPSLLAQVLLAYANACGERCAGGVRLRVKRTQLELAQTIGANERTVNRLLVQWRALGIVDKRQGRHVLLAPERLEALVDEHSRALVHRGHA
jgi:CRP-like cAMP-binding protein